MSSVDYNMLISTLESTVVTEYIKEDIPAYSYQSEADLEREFIKNLQNQGYEYFSIHNEKELRGLTNESFLTKIFKSDGRY